MHLSGHASCYCESHEIVTALLPRKSKEYSRLCALLVVFIAYRPFIENPDWLIAGQPSDSPPSLVYSIAPCLVLDTDAHQSFLRKCYNRYPDPISRPMWSGQEEPIPTFIREQNKTDIDSTLSQRGTNQLLIDHDSCKLTVFWTQIRVDITSMNKNITTKTT
jgi:hypothetical protein